MQHFYEVEGPQVQKWLQKMWCNCRLVSRKKRQVLLLAVKPGPAPRPSAPKCQDCDRIFQHCALADSIFRSCSSVSGRTQFSFLVQPCTVPQGGAPGRVDQVRTRPTFSLFFKSPWKTMKTDTTFVRMRSGDHLGDRLCGICRETVEHMFFHCREIKAAYAFWFVLANKCMSPTGTVPAITKLTCADMIIGMKDQPKSETTNTLASMLLHSIWVTRNKTVHREGLCDREGTVTIRIQLYLKKLHQVKLSRGQDQEQADRISKVLGWLVPDQWQQ